MIQQHVVATTHVVVVVVVVVVGIDIRHIDNQRNLRRQENTTSG